MGNCVTVKKDGESKGDTIEKKKPPKPDKKKDDKENSEKQHEKPESDVPESKK